MQLIDLNSQYSVEYSYSYRKYGLISVNRVLRELFNSPEEAIQYMKENKLPMASRNFRWTKPPGGEKLLQQAK